MDTVIDNLARAIRKLAAAGINTHIPYTVDADGRFTDQAPGFAGKDRVNPGSLVLSAEMMLRYLGWVEAADLVMKGVSNAIAAKEVTFDLARLRETVRRSKRELAGRAPAEDTQKLIPGATLMSCSGFGEAIVRHMAD